MFLARRLHAREGVRAEVVHPAFDPREILAAGAEVLIATIPPVVSGNDVEREWVERTNAFLVPPLPGDRPIDFSSGMTREDYAFDGVHIIASGRRKCAEAALRALSGT